MIKQEGYFFNRSKILEDFQSALEEVHPGPKTLYEQFSTLSVFQSIVSQEMYILYVEKFKPSYNILQKEKEVFKEMVRLTQSIFGEEYQLWYNTAKQNF